MYKSDYNISVKNMHIRKINRVSFNKFTTTLHFCIVHDISHMFIIVLSIFIEYHFIPLMIYQQTLCIKPLFSLNHNIIFNRSLQNAFSIEYKIMFKMQFSLIFRI